MPSGRPKLLMVVGCLSDEDEDGCSE